MMKIINMWKNVKEARKTKRSIKEVKFSDINIDEYILLDVRSWREYKENHLDGAINIQLPDVKKNIEKHIKDKEKKILVYCEYGARSARAVKILENLGYEEVYNLKGGLENI